MRKDYREENRFKKGGRVGHQIHIIIEKDKSKKPRRYSKSENDNKLDNTLYHKSSSFAAPRQTLNQTNGKGRKLNTEAERIYQGKNGAQRLKEGGNVKREHHFFGGFLKGLSRNPHSVNDSLKSFLGGDGILSKITRGAIKEFTPNSQKSIADNFFNNLQQKNQSSNTSSSLQRPVAMPSVSQNNSIQSAKSGKWIKSETLKNFHKK